MVLVTLVACGGASPDLWSAPTPWTWSPGEDEPVVVGLPEVERGLAGIVDLVRLANPRDVLDAYEAALTLGDPSCPVYQGHNGQDYVTGECTTTDGAKFCGFGLSTRLAGLVMEERWHRHWEWFTGTFRAEGVDGTSLSVSGDALYRAYDEQDGAYCYAGDLVGAFTWEGPAVPEVAWASEGVAVDLHLDTQRVHPKENLFQLAGAASGFDPTIIGFETDGLRWEDSTCPREPAGALRLVTSDLAWLTVDFDGDCDGCGALTGLDGVSEACVDWAPLVAWDDSPW